MSFRIKSRLSMGVSFPLGTFDKDGNEQFLELPASKDGEEHEVTVDTLPEAVEASIRGIYGGQIKLDGGPSRPRPELGQTTLTPEEADAQIAAIRARVVSPIAGTPEDPARRTVLSEEDAKADLAGTPRPVKSATLGGSPSAPTETAQKAAEQQRAEKSKEAAAGEPKKP